MSRRLIHDKLITDFTTLQFGNTNSLFTNVKKHYPLTSMKGGDALIVKDGFSENIQGIVSTERNYDFLFITYEAIESSLSQNDSDAKLDRLSEVEDKVLDYLQKEPNNLRSWGFSQSPSIEVVKIRVVSNLYDTLQAENGYVKELQIRFTITTRIDSQNI